MPKRNNPSAFDLEQMLTYRVSRLYHRLAAGTARTVEAGFGLAVREWRVLALLGKHGFISARDLVARSPMDKGSVSRAVASLSKKRLIAIQPDPADKRMQRLALTASGKKMCSSIAPHSLARQRALLNALTPAERAAIFRTLDKLITCADQLLSRDSGVSAPRALKGPRRVREGGRKK